MWGLQLLFSSCVVELTGSTQVPRESTTCCRDCSLPFCRMAFESVAILLNCALHELRMSFLVAMTCIVVQPAEFGGFVYVIPGA